METTQLRVAMIICAVLTGLSRAEQIFTAMYIFGDSLIDPGNNIYFINTQAKGNYRPYGIDFPLGPTGRFCNGETIVDVLGKLMGFPLIPSWADTELKHENIIYGVNYASAASGILDDTGHAFGRVISLRQQIENLKKTLNQLRYRMSRQELSKYLANAVVFVDMGANDYLNYYTLPNVYKSIQIYNPQEFANLLIKQYTGFIMEIQDLGLRKFILAEIAPLGCSPAVRFIKPTPLGQCELKLNNLVQMFNTQLKPLVDRLNSENPGSVFTVGPASEVFFKLWDNAEAYGITVKYETCCMIELNKTEKVKCARNSVPCSNRDEHFFWDTAHPTQAANEILAHLFYNGTSGSYPVNIQQLSKM